MFVKSIYYYYYYYYYHHHHHFISHIIFICVNYAICQSYKVFLLLDDGKDKSNNKLKNSRIKIERDPKYRNQKYVFE